MTAWWPGTGPGGDRPAQGGLCCSAHGGGEIGVDVADGRVLFNSQELNFLFV